MSILFVADLMGTRPPAGIDGSEPVTLRFVPLSLATDQPGWRVAGAWRLESDDPRIGGLSSLERDGEGLLAISDSARIMRFDDPTARPEQAVAVNWLKRADGYALGFNDTEAMAMTEEAFFVAREVRHALLEYAPDRRTLRATYDIVADWPPNGGVEAMVAPHQGEPMLLLSERRRVALAFDGADFSTVEITGVKGWPTDATRLPDGRILILSRTIRPWGFGAWVAQARYANGTIDVGPARRLPLSFRDNAEGIAAAPLANGATRLWIVTDDNGNRYMRTVLVAIDVDADAWPDMP